MTQKDIELSFGMVHGDFSAITLPSVYVCAEAREGKSEGGWSSCLVIQFQSPVSPGCRWFETICEEDDC